MHISSTRFGEIEVRDDALLEFPDGLIGLPGSGYALIARNPASPFLWLHSTEHADVAVPVTSPWLFFPEYEVKVSDADAARIGLASADQASILCVVRATPVPAETTINLVSPIVVHTAERLGRQIINDAHGYAVRHPLFGEVELDDAQPVAPGIPVEATAI